MNPSRDGLPAVAKYNTPDGDEMLLIRGIEQATHAIRRGHSVSAHAYLTYRRLIDRVEALREALDHREEIQGSGSDRTAGRSQPTHRDGPTDNGDEA